MAEEERAPSPPPAGAPFTVVLKPLPKHASAKQVKQLILRKRSVQCGKITHCGPCAFVACGSEEQMRQAIDKLHGATFKGVQLRAKRAESEPDSAAKRARLDGDAAASPQATAAVPSEERMLDVVAPLRRLPYAEQLAAKQRACAATADRLRARLTECGVDQSSLLFDVADVLPSPVTVGYRNKCEFAVGRDPAGRPTVGFVCGRRADGTGAPYVFPVGRCCHVGEPVKRLVGAFESRVLSASKLDMFDEKRRRGVWKMLTVRSFPGDMMAIVTVGVRHPSKAKPADDSDAAAATIEAAKGELLPLTADAPSLAAGFYLTSLYLACQVDMSDEPVYERLWGAPYIYDSLMGVQFRVSPAAFFQPNSAAAEKLYATIIDRAQLADGDVVLDLCCGTGTIALCVAAHAPRVRCVLGVELCRPAVEDAKRNCADNSRLLGGTPCRFACGRAEDVFNDIKYMAPKGEDGKQLDAEDGSCRIVAIVDPPRAGLHAKLIHALRSAKSVRRLVYVSCEPKLASNNFVNLCRPVSNRYTGECFVLKSITPVDMFPMTELCEWVVVFERQ